MFRLDNLLEYNIWAVWTGVGSVEVFCFSVNEPEEIERWEEVEEVEVSKGSEEGEGEEGRKEESEIGLTTEEDDEPDEREEEDELFVKGETVAESSLDGDRVDELLDEESTETDFEETAVEGSLIDDGNVLIELDDALTEEGDTTTDGGDTTTEEGDTVADDGVTSTDDGGAAAEVGGAAVVVGAAVVAATVVVGAAAVVGVVAAEVGAAAEVGGAAAEVGGAWTVVAADMTPSMAGAETVGLTGTWVFLSTHNINNFWFCSLQHCSPFFSALPTPLSITKSRRLPIAFVKYDNYAPITQKRIHS
ncbi:uncharacterized protein LACBIDRAFT_331810 [Laccaria bicolor S238N-H82]|uniref:Predicted protein n=1 Tax=Laccaria bicolor (strain S238N-H82 / ATCC MYA-4686) TaxID=486041 RepID=B0DQN1_LACBS|nr:uncharacterized protein LACBIDRAFT_331810 [Laccaria bicolor S238N-H82]EDR03146.1 predicted protein [Laccaria bicolor S238N-H82]|eukprot:XP_001886287.1 predicted protein [Laccaria bicolor S238N-H82]